MGIGALILSFLLNLLAWKMYGTPEAISFASILTLLVWYIITVSYLKKSWISLIKKPDFYVVCQYMFLYRCFQYKSSCKGFPGLRSRIYFNYNCFYKEDIKKLFYGSLGKRRG